MSSSVVTDSSEIPSADHTVAENVPYATALRSTLTTLYVASFPFSALNTQVDVSNPKFLPHLWVENPSPNFGETPIVHDSETHIEVPPTTTSASVDVAGENFSSATPDSASANDTSPASSGVTERIAGEQPVAVPSQQVNTDSVSPRKVERKKTKRQELVEATKELHKDESYEQFTSLGFDKTTKQSDTAAESEGELSNSSEGEEFDPSEYLKFGWSSASYRDDEPEPVDLQTEQDEMFGETAAAKRSREQEELAAKRERYQRTQDGANAGRNPTRDLLRELNDTEW